LDPLGWPILLALLTIIVPHCPGVQRRNPHFLPLNDPRSCLIHHPLQIPSLDILLQPNLQTIGHLPRLCVGWDFDPEGREDEDEGSYAEGGDREDEEGFAECELIEVVAMSGGGRPQKLNGNAVSCPVRST
jgi:hypothetical protein